eukprot:EG_transcript_12577
MANSTVAERPGGNFPSSPINRDLTTEAVLTAAARRTNFINVAIMAANMVSVVGCVVLLKAVYEAPYEFRFASTIITFHFLCTACMINLCCLFKLYTPKRIPTKQYIQLSLAQVASVGFVNLSLYHNSIGMYQVLKFCNVPVICVMEYFLLKTSYSVEIYIALAFVILGVMMTSVTEISFSALGFCFGLLGTVSTGVYQLLNKHIQRNCEVNAMQLLQFESWFTVFWSFLWALACDDIPKLVAYQWTFESAALVVVGGFCAFGVTLTCYLVIGRTSPVTYGVTSHVKTIAILLFGFLVLRQPFHLKNLVGIGAAFLGVVYYTHIKLQEQREQIARAASASANAADGVPDKLGKSPV